MAKAWVTEYPRLVRDDDEGKFPLAPEPASVNQAVTFTTSTQSSAFDAETRFVRIVADADCHIAFGDSPAATANSQYLPAGMEAWRGVQPGDKVAIYDGSS